MDFEAANGAEEQNGAEPVYGPGYRRPLSETGAAARQTLDAARFNGPAPPYTAPYPPYPSDVPDVLPISHTSAAALAYLVAPAVFFLLLPPYRSQPLLRFHSWQAIFFFIVAVALREVEQVLASMLPSAGAFLVSGLLLLLLLTGWLVCVLKALQGEVYLLPLVGRFAQNTSSSTSLRR